MYQFTNFPEPPTHLSFETGIERVDGNPVKMVFYAWENGCRSVICDIDIAYHLGTEDMLQLISEEVVDSMIFAWKAGYIKAQKDIRKAIGVE
jgi:hypothetical protein